MTYKGPRNYPGRNKHNGPYPRPLAERFWEKTQPEPNSGCILWLAALSDNGYGQIGLGGVKDGRGYAHRVAWELVNGPIPEGLHVCHKCDTRCCVNASHMFLGTAKDNLHDCIAKGRNTRGQDSHFAKLTESEVLAIRSSEGSHRATARTFGISDTQVRLIRRRETWKHLP